MSLEYYLYAILDVWYKYTFEFCFLGIGFIFLAVMDFINFQFPKDSGFFSLHTKGSRFDAWHLSKRIAIFCFALAAIGDGQLLYLINNPFIQIALLAIVCQWVYHLLKRIKKYIDHILINKE